MAQETPEKGPDPEKIRKSPEPAPSSEPAPNPGDNPPDRWVELEGTPSTEGSGSDVGGPEFVPASPPSLPSASSTADEQRDGKQPAGVDADRSGSDSSSAGEAPDPPSAELAGRSEPSSETSAEASPDPAAATPDMAEAIPETAKLSPDPAESSPDTGKSTRDKAETSPEAAESIPDTAKISPDIAKTSRETVKISPDPAEAPPDTTEASPDIASPAPLPRPRPQWKVLEPEDRSDPVEHAVCECLRRNDQWNIVAASVRGKLHAHKGMWREDAYRVGWVNDWTIIAVSDGAGSADLSRIGARVACDESVASLKSVLAGWNPQQNEQGRPAKNDLIRLRTFLVEAARKAQEGIIRAAQTRDCSAKDMHATLLLLVHVPVGEEELVGTIQVGDGAVGLYVEDGSCTLLGVADHGEYSSETRFLTTPNIEREFERRVLFSIKSGIQSLAVMCDGVADDFFPEDQRLIELFAGDPIQDLKTADGEPLRGVMHQVVEDPREGKTLLEWLKYERKASSDDRTLVLMYRSGDKWER